MAKKKQKGGIFIEKWRDNKNYLVVRDEKGRFATKGSAASVKAAKSALAKALTQPRTKKSAQALSDKLEMLTVKQLADLKKEYGIKASGRTKQQLIDKLADRLDRGRRNPAVKKKAAKKKTPNKKREAERRAAERRAAEQKEAETKQASRSELQERLKATGVSHRIASDVSDEFLQTATETLEKIPAGARRTVAASGAQVAMGEFVTDIWPKLKGVKPRGWPEGMTWDNADGMFSRGNKVIGVSEKRNDYLGLPVKSNRTSGVLNHEFGHAFDDAFSPPISESAEFQQAYEADVKSISERDQKLLSYFLQSGDAGKSEAVAEGFAIIAGAAGSASLAPLFRQSFPSVLAHIEKRITNEDMYSDTW